MLKIKWKTENFRGERAAELGAYTVFYLGLFLSVMTACKIEGKGLIAAVPGLCLVLGCIGTEGMKKQEGLRKILHILLGVFAGILPVILLLGVTGIYQGALSVYNALLENIGRFLGKFMVSYEISQAEDLLPVLKSLFLLFLGLFFAGVCEAVRMAKNRILVLVLGTAAMVFNLCLYPKTIPVSIPVMTAGILMLWMRFGEVDDASGRRAGSSKSFAGLQNMVIAGLLFLTAVFAVRTIGQHGVLNGAAQAVQQTVKKQVSRLRYGKKTTDSMPKGQFLDLGNLELTEETALEVIMEKPSSMYLKGFIGSVYTEEGWQEADKEAVYDAKSLFYWLHESDFSGLTQLSSLYGLEHPGDSDTGKIVVKTVGADREYFYVPYELASLPEEVDGAESFGDAALKAVGFVPESTCQYQAHTELVSQYPQIASDYYLTKDTDGMAEYVKNEGSYNAFVYQNFLDVPENLQLLFEKLFDMPKASGQAHLSYEEANTQITGYLNENVRYSEEISETSTDKDFVQQFLEVSRKGYSVHYATAAVLMYRYFGIPARYVEGYLVTPEAAEGVDSYDKITVTGKDAHAWVEIYQDGVGWIPMEVTPEYMDKMERPEYEIAAYTSSMEQAGAAGEDAPEEIRDEEEQKPETEKGKTKLPIRQVLIVLGVLALLVVILAVAVYEIKGRKRLEEEKRKLAQAVGSAAVCGHYAWMMRWLFYDGLSDVGGSRYDRKAEIAEKYGSDFAKEYEKITAIAEEAAYSSHVMEQRQIEAVKELQEKACAVILERAAWKKKLRMRWVDFLY